MSAIDDQTRLQHIWDAAEKIARFTQGKDLEDLENDELLQLALVRLVEIIGEAAARLTDEFKSTHTEIPWASIVGMRNRLVHAYFSIDLNIVWNTVTKAIPDLQKKVDIILTSEINKTDCDSESDEE